MRKRTILLATTATLALLVGTAVNAGAQTYGASAQASGSNSTRTWPDGSQITEATASATATWPDGSEINGRNYSQSFDPNGPMPKAPTYVWYSRPKYTYLWSCTPNGGCIYWIDVVPGKLKVKGPDGNFVVTGPSSNTLEQYLGTNYSNINAGYYNPYAMYYNPYAWNAFGVGLAGLNPFGFNSTFTGTPAVFPSVISGTEPVKPGSTFNPTLPGTPGVFPSVVSGTEPVKAFNVRPPSTFAPGMPFVDPSFTGGSQPVKRFDVRPPNTFAPGMPFVDPSFTGGLQPVKGANGMTPNRTVAGRR